MLNVLNSQDHCATWLVKQEAKHNMFKKYGSVCNNFRKLPKTMVNLNQMTQCSIWGTNRQTVREKIQYNFGKNITVKDKNMTKLWIQKGFQENDVLIRMDQVQVYGINFQTDSFVAIDSGLNVKTNMPVFRLIQEIFIKDDQVYLFCKEWQACWLEESLNSYCVEEGPDHVIISTDELCDSKPLALWNDFSTNLPYICL